MKYSKAFIETMKEAPGDSNTLSYNYIVRASLVKKVNGGSYVLMPLGVRSTNKIKCAIKNILGKNNFNEIVSDSNNTLEEEDEIYLFGKNYIKSYKQFPLGIYNFYDYKKDSKSILGWCRVKDANILKNYLFSSEENATNSMKSLCESYKEILKTLGIENYNVWESEDEINFAFLNENGEDDIVYCESCGYVDSLESARSMPEKREKEEFKPIEEIYTPDTGTIEALVAFCGVDPEDTIKTLVFSTSKEPVAVIVVGEKNVNEHKVRAFLKETNLEMANADILYKMTGAITGYAGPIGIKTSKLLVDEETQYIYNFMAGANKTDYHIDKVNYGRDFTGIIGDFRVVEENDKCICCGKPLKIVSGSKFATIKKEDTEISKASELSYLNEKGISNFVSIVKGDLNISKLLVYIAENSKSETGILWANGIAPFDVDVCPVNVKNEEQRNLGEKIYVDLKSLNYDVLLDDRDERAGVKFKDCELIGIPVRVTIGKKAGEGIVELKVNNGEQEEVHIDNLLEKIRQYI